MNLRNKTIFLAKLVSFPAQEASARLDPKKNVIFTNGSRVLKLNKKLSTCLEASVTQVNGSFDACCVYRSSPKET